MSLHSNFKANCFKKNPVRTSTVAAWLETPRVPLAADYESLRIGGLVFAVVLFLMGIALIVSKSLTTWSAETLATLWLLRQPWPRPRPRAITPRWGRGDGELNKQSSVSPGRAQASYTSWLLGLYTSSLHSVAAVILLSLPAHAVTASSPETQSLSVVHVFRSSTLYLGLFSSPSFAPWRKTHPHDPNHVDLFRHRSRLPCLLRTVDSHWKQQI